MNDLWRLLVMKSIFWDTTQYFWLKFCTTGHTKQIVGALWPQYPTVWLTFMITNGLYVQRMITFSVYKVVFINTWPLNADVCTVNSADHTREADSWRSRPVWSQFSCLHRAKQWTYVGDVLEPVDFGSQNVSPITSRKLPDAKKRKATRTWISGESAWLRAVFLARSSDNKSAPRLNVIFA